MKVGALNPFMEMKIVLNYNWGINSLMNSDFKDIIRPVELLYYTAIALLVLVSLISYIYYSRAHKNRKNNLIKRHCIYSLLSLAIGICLTLLISAQLKINREESINLILKGRQETVNNEISSTFKSSFKSLEYLAKRRSKNEIIDEPSWDEISDYYYQEFPFFQALSWVDNTYHVRWIHPDATNEAARDLDLSFEKSRYTALLMAKENATIVVSKTIKLVQGGLGILVFVPVYTGNEFKGFISGVYRLDKMFNELMRKYNKDLEYIVRVGDLDVCSYGANNPKYKTLISHEKMGLFEWQISLSPTTQYWKSINNHDWAYALLLGCVIATLLSGVIYLRLNALRQSISLRLLNDDLTTQNHALEDARKAANLATTAKSDFLANMSHELRTPMNSILGFTYRLIKRQGDQLPEQDLDALQTVDRNARHLLALINDILDLSKIEAGKMEIIRESVNIGVLVDNVLSENASLFDSKKLALKTKLIEIPEILQLDKRKIRQILTNLISNAIKYTDEGSIEITMTKIRDPRIGEAISIAVLDTGIGIEDSLKPLIFNKFIMADSSTKRKTTGTGLGLAISRQYANFHGGHIDVKSEYGVGSCFTLTLPLKKDVLVNKGTTRLSAKKRPTILCVDDEPDVLKLLSSSLQGEGFNVLTAANGNKALEIIEQQKPDLICLDLIMPGISGFDLIHEIRKKFSDTELPIIVISAHEEHLHAIQSGANAYLSKPIQNSSLLKEIQWGK